MYLAAGSFPEEDREGRLYNTGYVFDRQGRELARHRKMHLFDIQVEGGQCFRESDTFSPGDTYTVFDTEFGRMGLCICFDIRFPELFSLMVQVGARLVLVPAAFNRTTGPAHWDLVFRQRAVDGQCFTAGAAPARDPAAAYVSYGPFPGCLTLGRGDPAVRDRRTSRSGGAGSPADGWPCGSSFPCCPPGARICTKRAGKKIDKGEIPLKNAKAKGSCLPHFPPCCSALPRLCGPELHMGSTPETLSFYRNLLVLPVLAVIMVLRRIPFRVPWRILGTIVLVGVLGRGITTLMLYSSYTYIGVGTATTLHFLFPVFVALICRVFYRERIGGAVWPLWSWPAEESFSSWRGAAIR